jgi:hypothetical protein
MSTNFRTETGCSSRELNVGKALSCCNYVGAVNLPWRTSGGKRSSQVEPSATDVALGAESDTEKKKSRELRQSALLASHFIDRNEPHAPRQIDVGK